MSDAGTGSPHVLRDYALLADGHRGALVGPRGNVAWMCAPAGTRARCSARSSRPPGTTASPPASGSSGRLLRGRLAGVAQPMGHDRRRRRVPRRARVPPATPTAWSCYAGSSPATPPPRCAWCSTPAPTTGDTARADCTATTPAAGTPGSVTSPCAGPGASAPRWAELSLVKVPAQRSLAGRYRDVVAAAREVPTVMRHEPTALEGVDHQLVHLEYSEAIRSAED